MPDPLLLCLRSAAEDLDLDPGGWRPVPDPETQPCHAFVHRDQPGLTLVASASPHGWYWSIGPIARPAAALDGTGPWVCVGLAGASLCGNERASLLEALRQGGDDLPVAVTCSTEMLRSRLEHIVRQTGMDLSVIAVQPGAAAAAEPACPLALSWSYRVLGGNGVRREGQVRAASEREAVEAVNAVEPGTELLELCPEMPAHAPRLDPLARRELSCWLRDHSPEIAALLT